MSSAQGIEWECVICGEKSILLLPHHDLEDAQTLLTASLAAESRCCGEAVQARLLGYPDLFSFEDARTPTLLIRRKRSI